MPVWVRGFRWVYSSCAINTRTPENLNVGQTAQCINLRYNTLGLWLSLTLPGHWTQISISHEWRDYAGRVSRRLDGFPLLPSEAQRTHISRLRFNSFDIHTKLTRTAVCREQLYLTIRMCASWILRSCTKCLEQNKGSKDRRVWVSESRPTLCKCFPEHRVGTFFSLLPHSHTHYVIYVPLIYCKDFFVCYVSKICSEDMPGLKYCPYNQMCSMWPCR